ncbi:MAG: tetratricopeptide repeat protein [Desulfohalobiaceae bacterium]
MRSVSFRTGAASGRSATGGYRGTSRLVRLLSGVFAVCFLFLAGVSGANTGMQEGFASLRHDDYSRAGEVFRPLAEQGESTAMYNLGLLLDKGLGLEQDRGSAATWYRLAAERGDARAQYNLALLYIEGKGVDQDYDRAVELLRRAADAGLARAQYNLGILASEGLGMPISYDRSRQWFNRASQSGFRKGECDLNYVGLCMSRAEFRLGEGSD